MKIQCRSCIYEGEFSHAGGKERGVREEEGSQDVHDGRMRLSERWSVRECKGIAG